MTTVGFDPERTRALARSVVAATDELTAIRSDDPAAGDALRVVASTRHTLQNSWLPALERIIASDALTSWNGGGPAPMCELWATRLAPTTRRVTHEVALERLRRGEPDIDLLDSLAGDPDFRRGLLAAVAARPQIASELASAGLDAALRADVLVTVLRAVGRVHGAEWEALARAADRLMESLGAHPAQALRVLLHRDTLWLFAEWPFLDQAVVADFVHDALATAVTEDPSRHPDGVTVLGRLIELSDHDRLDGTGFAPGMSVGLASAIGAYVPSFVDTVRLESGTVSARSRGASGELDVTLGTYEEMTDFFGAILRAEPAAQRILGAELAAFARLAVEQGDGVPGTVRLDTVAELAELLQHAADSEDEEARLADAARRAGALPTSTLLAFTTSALFLVTSRGNPVAGFVLDRAVTDLVDLTVRPRDRPPPVDARLASATHQVVVSAAIGRVSRDPGLRRSYRIRGSVRDWAAVASRLEDLGDFAADQPAGQAADLAAVREDGAEIDRRLHQLEADARELGAGAYLDELLTRPAVHDLTDARPPG